MLPVAIWVSIFLIHGFSSQLPSLRNFILFCSQFLDSDSESELLFSFPRKPLTLTSSEHMWQGHSKKELQRYILVKDCLQGTLKDCRSSFCGVQLHYRWFVQLFLVAVTIFILSEAFTQDPIVLSGSVRELSHSVNLANPIDMHSLCYLICQEIFWLFLFL